jgi:hypothetical protein
MENQNIHKFSCFRESSIKGQRCSKPCFNNRCGWREPKKESILNIELK